MGPGGTNDNIRNPRGGMKIIHNLKRTIRVRVSQNFLGSSKTIREMAEDHDFLNLRASLQQKWRGHLPLETRTDNERNARLRGRASGQQR